MRHLIYREIAQNYDLRDYSGLLMLCSFTNEEAAIYLMKTRCNVLQTEEKRWSELYAAPVRIVKPKILHDFTTTKVQLPLSMFATGHQIPVVCDKLLFATPEYDLTNHNKDMAMYSTCIIWSDEDILPMGQFPLKHLEYTTYVDNPTVAVDPNAVEHFAAAIDQTLYRVHMRLCLLTCNIFGSLQAARQYQSQACKYHGQPGIEFIPSDLPMKADKISFDWTSVLYKEDVNIDVTGCGLPRDSSLNGRTIGALRSGRLRS